MQSTDGPKTTLAPWQQAEVDSLIAVNKLQRERAAIYAEFKGNAHAMAFEIQELRSRINAQP